MASLTTMKDGSKRVQFVDGNGVRRTIYLGDVPMKTAKSVLTWVEAINDARSTSTGLPSGAAGWLNSLPDTMYAKLMGVGLADPRSSAAAPVGPLALDAMLSQFFAVWRGKESTAIRMRQACDSLLEHFGPGHSVHAIGLPQAQEWRAALVDAGYSEATISRTVLYARQYWTWAVDAELVSSNPFRKVRAGSQRNEARSVMIDRPTIAGVMDAAPDAEWRLLIALGRFGGLRIPSEALRLTWQDVMWDLDLIRVRSPKTEHHEGKGERMVPLFPELRPLLLAAFEEAPEGTHYVIQRYREGANLNPGLRRIIRMAGLVPWPRTWHNLRASRQTELVAEGFAEHVVCSWIGNSKQIARDHYLHITEADIARAVGKTHETTHATTQNPTQQAPEPKRTESHDQIEVVVGTGDMGDGETPEPIFPDSQVGSPGLEPGTPAFSVPCSTN